MAPGHDFQYSFPTTHEILKEKSKKSFLTKCIIITVIIGTMAAVSAYLTIFYYNRTIYPVLEFFPKPNNTESSLISVQLPSDDDDSYMKWIININQFLEPYYNTLSSYSSFVRCGHNRPPRQESVCMYDTKQLELCDRNQDIDWQYSRGSPCIYLRIKPEKDWRPDFYNKSDIEHGRLPAKMPRQLVEHIAFIEGEELNTVWVSCKGDLSPDMEFLEDITYYPSLQGFPGYYFPDKGVAGYLGPIVALHLTKPARGVVISIECMAWAKNIDHDKGMGIANFQLLLE